MTKRAKALWQRFKTFMIARLQESSTVRGLVYLVGGAAAVANPTKLDAIVTAVILIAGLIGALFPDKIKKPNDDTGS